MTGPKTKPLDLDSEGERHFGLLRDALEIGEGFELFFVCCASTRILQEIERRLAETSGSGIHCQTLTYDEPSRMNRVLEDLLQHGATEKETRLAISVRGQGRESELRAGWTQALVLLNEQRNRLIRECSFAILLAGPLWLIDIAQNTAPDLWSVRSSVFFMPENLPPSSMPSGSIMVSRDEDAQPMDHELRPGEYYASLARALEGSRGEVNRLTRMSLLLQAARSWRLRGELGKARDVLDHVVEMCTKAKDARTRAIALAHTADVLEQRGETDEALRIWREEELPVYERLGDEKSRAVTMGKIADILQERGETEEALRTWREEVVPVLEQLGDLRNRAVAMSKIADILQQRGETDEALRALREEAIPVLEQLSDLRSRAIAMSKIADILQQRGETDEALRILREEVLPVFERLGDVRSRAATMGQIANILEQRGETDEALRILREEVLPVFERLGDVRSRAATMGQIANILHRRGETNEALRVRREEVLPVYERLGDLDGIAVTRFNCAGIRIDRNGLEKGETQTILDELAESLRLSRKIKRLDGIAFSGHRLAQCLTKLGRTSEALPVLEESVAAFKKLGMAGEAAEARKLLEEIREKAK